MRKYFIVLLVLVLLGIVGCDDIDCAIDPVECEFWGISPIATPTPTPDIDTIQQDVDNWLDDYLSKGKLW